MCSKSIMQTAKITEIFSSIQGEGPYVGEEQTFMRFYGCNLACSFCDENKKTDFLEYSVSEVIEAVIKEGKRTVSLTGGEPLLHTDFLKEFLPVLKAKQLKIYLETNGTLKDGLLEILDFVDIISMDFKLPSSTGLRAYWDEHSAFLNSIGKYKHRFLPPFRAGLKGFSPLRKGLKPLNPELKLGRSRSRTESGVTSEEDVRKEVFVKVVVTQQTVLSDIEKAVSIVKGVDKNIPFIIQPVGYNGSIERIDLMQVFFKSAIEELENVRIIPQVHKILGVK